MSKRAQQRQEMKDVNPVQKRSEAVYEPTPVIRPEHSESSLTRLIEQQSAKIPSDVFLVAAMGAMGVSLYCYLRGNRDRSNLLGLWAPTLLTMGVYNKLVKLLRPR